MMHYTHKAVDLDALADLAQTLAPNLMAGDVILLDGDLGAGKTQFAKYLIAALNDGAPIEVISPTFTLLQTYETPQAEVYHFDLYRLENEEEIEAIGLDEALVNGISLIEWPGRLGAFRPRHHIDLRLKINPDETRHIDITLQGDKAWQERHALKQGLGTWQHI